MLAKITRHRCKMRIPTCTPLLPYISTSCGLCKVQLPFVYLSPTPHATFSKLCFPLSFSICSHLIRPLQNALPSISLSTDTLVRPSARHNSPSAYLTFIPYQIRLSAADNPTSLYTPLSLLIPLSFADRILEAADNLLDAHTGPAPLPVATPCP